MRRLAYRQVHHSNRAVQPLRLAPVGANANPARVFGKRHLGSVPASCAFLGMGKKSKGAPAQRGGVQGSAFGNGAGSPQNGKKEGWPLWSPQKIYWLIDDLVYKAVDAAHRGIDFIARKLGKKSGVSKLGLALGVSTATGLSTGTLVAVARPEQLFNAALGVVTYLCTFWCIAMDKKSEDAEALEAEASGCMPDRLLSSVFKWARLPCLLSAGLALSPEILPSFLHRVGFAVFVTGASISQYLLSDENGTGKKVREALGQLMENLQAGLAKKSPVPVKGEK